MATVGIIVAMAGEARPLLRLVGAARAGRLGGRKTWRFDAGTARCVMVLTGMGLEPARKAARVLVDAESPEALLSFGIAGALGEDLAIGDIVSGERCRMWESGKLGDALPLAALPGAAYRAAAGAAQGARCARATIVTVRGIQPVHAVLRETAVVEMETFGIAQLAAERGIPLYSLRAISDSPGEPIPFTMDGGEDFHLRPFTLMGALIRNPRIIRPLLRLKDNSAKAAQELAAVVLAVLPCLCP